MKPLVIYHANCRDGFTAAWVCAEALGDVELHPAHYGDAPPENTDGRTIYIVDFSYKEDVLLELCANAAAVVVLDHHKSAEEELRNLVGYTEDYGLLVEFDMERSGAGMAWDHFHPDADDNRPAIVDYVQDRDLWRFELAESRSVNAYIALSEMTLEQWVTIDYEIEFEFERVFAIGGAVRLRETLLVKQICQNVRPLMIDGFEVPSVNSSVLQSETGNVLCMAPEAPFSAVWYQLQDGRFAFSLRSLDSKEDVSVIAKRYGGGGHRNAAGFTVNSFDDIFKVPF